MRQASLATLRVDEGNIYPILKNKKLWLDISVEKGHVFENIKINALVQRSAVEP